LDPDTVPYLETSIISKVFTLAHVKAKYILLWQLESPEETLVATGQTYKKTIKKGGSGIQTLKTLWQPNKQKGVLPMKIRCTIELFQIIILNGLCKIY
jgi:hypothetical protein